jgi:ATP-binding cassette subfamily C protein LapB
MLVLIDEPTESLDAEGCAAIHQILGALAQKGRTIIVMSHDRNIVKGPHVVVDLNVKPVPTIAGPGPYPVPAELGAAAMKRNIPTPQTEFAVEGERKTEEASVPGVRSFSL